MHFPTIRLFIRFENAINMNYELNDMSMVAGELTGSLHGHARVVQVVGGGLAGHVCRL